MQLLVSMVIKIYWVNLLHLFSPTPVRETLKISDVDSPELSTPARIRWKLSGRAGLLPSLVLSPLLRALMGGMLLGLPSSHLLKTLFTNGLTVLQGGRERVNQHIFWIKKPKWELRHFSCQESISVDFTFHHQSLTALNAVFTLCSRRAILSLDCCSSEINEQVLPLLFPPAGVMLVPERKTEDGFEEHFGLNYLGHFLLTNLLLDTLKQSGTHSHSARIITVSSATHYVGKLLLNDLQSRYRSLFGIHWSVVILCRLKYKKIVTDYEELLRTMRWGFVAFFF